VTRYRKSGDRGYYAVEVPADRFLHGHGTVLCRTFERAGLDPAPILIGPADVDRSDLSSIDD
jgi:hypothetical protein